MSQNQLLNSNRHGYRPYNCNMYLNSLSPLQNIKQLYITVIDGILFWGHKITDSWYSTKQNKKQHTCIIKLKWVDLHIIDNNRYRYVVRTTIYVDTSCGKIDILALWISEISMFGSTFIHTRSKDNVVGKNNMATANQQIK